MAVDGPAFSKPSLLRTITLVIAAIALLFLADRFLASLESSQSRVEAERLFHEGQKSLGQGLGEKAAEQFQSALFIARDDKEYQLALSQALAAADRVPDAEATLAGLLERDANGGSANLAMARVLAREGRLAEAISYYHRAIYGQWEKDAIDHRVEVRFELVKLLAEHRSNEGLLAELLPLEEEAPDDVKTKMRLGALFMAAGSPVRAADLFHEVLQREPRNPEAWAGLGETEFARANYRPALNDFQTALRFRSTVTEADKVRHRMEICSQVLSLDPTQRGLSTEDRYRRSVRILDLILQDIGSCAGVPTGLTDTATKALKEHVPPSRQGMAYDSNVELADKLWQARKAGCSGAAPVPEVLSLTLNKLSQ
jgi:tetratricopeptide (TPR) repeat protein